MILFYSIHYITNDYNSFNTSFKISVFVKDFSKTFDLADTIIFLPGKWQIASI